VTKAGARVTPGLFELLGVRPLAGRTFVAGEGRAGTDDRALISEDVWRAQFGGDPAIIGKRIRLSGESVEVVGIMPADFRFRLRERACGGRSTWTPAAGPMSQPMAFARLAAGISQADAATVTTDTMHRADAATSEFGVRFDPLAKNYLDAYSVRAVTALGIGVGLVFLALCANALNLLLTRLTARRREFGVCSALGAPRGRLMRQARGESADRHRRIARRPRDQRGARRPRAQLSARGVRAAHAQSHQSRSARGRIRLACRSSRSCSRASRPPGSARAARPLARWICANARRRNHASSARSHADCS
jgi:hypothetical protein